jgi:hypothetical protein
MVNIRGYLLYFLSIYFCVAPLYAEEPLAEKSASDVDTVISEISAIINTPHAELPDVSFADVINRRLSSVNPFVSFVAPPVKIPEPVKAPQIPQLPQAIKRPVAPPRLPYPVVPNVPPHVVTRSAPPLPHIPTAPKPVPKVPQAPPRRN